MYKNHIKEIETRQNEYKKQLEIIKNEYISAFSTRKTVIIEWDETYTQANSLEINKEGKFIKKDVNNLINIDHNIFEINGINFITNKYTEEAKPEDVTDTELNIYASDIKEMLKNKNSYPLTITTYVINPEETAQKFLEKLITSNTDLSDQVEKFINFHSYRTEYATLVSYILQNLLGNSMYNFCNNIIPRKIQRYLFRYL